MREYLGYTYLSFICVILLIRTSLSLGLACDRIIADGIKWDLSMLGGPRSVVHTVDEVVSLKNTTYTIDICQGLVLKERKAGEILCPFGSRVCAMERIISDNTSILERGWPIAGELKEHSGGHMDEKWESIKSNPDSKIEGIKLRMNGGFLTRDDGKKRSQKAVVEFICDHTRIGTENLISPEDEYVLPKPNNALYAAGISRVSSKSEDGADPTTTSLTFVKYDQYEADSDILFLSWRTKFACEGTEKQSDPNEGHWGFFSWFILVLFLSIAAYTVFVSVLKYNRDGVRGCDMLPHSDTIRDIPYLLKDWTRRALNILQDGGIRRGYAAV